MRPTRAPRRGSILVLAGIAGYAGVLTLAVGPVPQALAAAIVFLVGVVLLVAGLPMKCPLYGLRGIDTCRSDTLESPESTERPR